MMHQQSSSVCRPLLTGQHRTHKVGCTTPAQIGNITTVLVHLMFWVLAADANRVQHWSSNLRELVAVYTLALQQRKHCLLYLACCLDCANAAAVPNEMTQQHYSMTRRHARACRWTQHCDLFSAAYPVLLHLACRCLCSPD
jgi:hypothetical protein